MFNKVQLFLQYLRVIEHYLGSIRLNHSRLFLQDCSVCDIVGRTVSLQWPGRAASMMHCTIRAFPSSALLHASAAGCIVEKVGCPGL